MTDDLFQLVFRGEVANGQRLEAVQAAVAELLRCDRQRLVRLFSGCEVVIKKNLDRLSAQKYKAIFERTGAICHLRQVEVPETSDIEMDRPVESPAVAGTMICPKCGEQQATAECCIGCGIYIEKYLQRQAELQRLPATGVVDYGEPLPEESVVEVDAEDSASFRENPGAYARALILPEAEPVNPVLLGFKALVLLVLLIWGGRFAFASIGSNYAGESVLHLINLPFHEAGHIFFRPLGRFMTSAGGSITQILVPLICLGAILLQTRDAFGAGICLWWTGQNFLDLAPYINDARAGVMPLVGGNTGRTSPYGFHDWEFLLNETGLLRFDHAIARGAHLFGVVLMSLGLVWAGLILYRQFRAGRES